MPKLKIIYTGGTIGGKAEPEGETKADINWKMFLKLLYKKCPSFERDVRRKIIELSHDTPVKEFSENMIPSDWTKIAESVDKAVKEGIDSIVIAHGTDTMCYTSAALSFMLQGIKIPVVVTGSNIPLDSEGTDAITNMHDAIRVALDKRFKGVFLVFSGIGNQPSDIHLGCRVRKAKFYDNCFESVNVDNIGKFKKRFLSKNTTVKVVNRKLLDQVIEINDRKDYQPEYNINANISFFKVYPGFNPDLIDYVVKEKGTKGLILELYNSGTGCIKNKYSLLKSLKTASEHIPVFITSQQEGSVTMDSYISSTKIKKEGGVVPLKSMITEAAIPKLMWVLGQKTSSKEEVIELMLTNICGEI